MSRRGAGESRTNLTLPGAEELISGVTDIKDRHEAEVGILKRFHPSPLSKAKEEINRVIG